MMDSAGQDSATATANRHSETATMCQGLMRMLSVLHQLGDRGRDRVRKVVGAVDVHMHLVQIEVGDVSFRETGEENGRRKPDHLDAGRLAGPVDALPDLGPMVLAILDKDY